MANSGKKMPAKRGKFDETVFFKYVKETAHRPLLQLLRSIDKRACIEMGTYVAAYLRPSGDEIAVLERRRRGARIQQALSDAIASLRDAESKYRELAAIEIPAAGSLAPPRAPEWPQGFPSLADVLQSEAARLSRMLEVSKKVFNEKRLGVSGNHVWLIFLQEFVSAWTAFELGKARRLRPSEAAALVQAGRIMAGWSREMSEADAENTRKAISNFRSNPANTWLSTVGAKQYALERCRHVLSAPYLLGIEI